MSRIQQRDALLASVWLMLLVIVPVMALTVLFAWHYRQSNTSARYEPEWDHSTQLELVIWGCAAAHHHRAGRAHLDGHASCSIPIGRSTESPRASRLRGNAKPIEVEVVALDWKWLFIYPQYGIATLNEAAVPARQAGRVPHHFVERHERLLRPRAWPA